MAMRTPLLAVPIVAMYVCMYTCTWHKALCTNQVLSPALICKDGMGLGWCWSMCSEGYLMVLTRHRSPSLLPPISLPPPLPPALPLPPPSAWPCTARTGTGSSSTMPATLRGSPHSSGEHIWSCAHLALSTTGPRILFTDCD